MIYNHNEKIANILLKFKPSFANKAKGFEKLYEKEQIYSNDKKGG